jgi:carbon storage regulator CsrA
MDTSLGAGMLVLHRRMGEALVIDGGIRVVVLSSTSRGARLGIVAPQATGVLREELTFGTGPARLEGDTYARSTAAAS